MFHKRTICSVRCLLEIENGKIPLERPSAITIRRRIEFIQTPRLDHVKQTPLFVFFTVNLTFVNLYVHLSEQKGFEHFIFQRNKMGGSNSKHVDRTKDKNVDKGGEFFQMVRSNVEDEIARRAMVQREVQMAINIAKARDNIFIFGSAWATLVTGVGVVKMVGKKTHPVVGVPIVVGGLLLGNLWDMAYGNKLMRVTREAEYLLENERGRFVPMKQAPFHKFYSDDDKRVYYDCSSAVGDIFPNSVWARPSSK